MKARENSSREFGPSQEQAPNRGDVLTAISDGLVALLKEFYGRGPTQTKSYYEDDLVVCVLRDGLSMSGNQQEPDMAPSISASKRLMCEVFMLAPSDVFVDERP